MHAASMVLIEQVEDLKKKKEELNTGLLTIELTASQKEQMFSKCRCCRD